MKEMTKSFKDCIDGIFHYLEKSFIDRKATKDEARIFGFYFSLLEECEDLIFLIENEKYSILPHGCRSVIERTMDIENSLETPNYQDRLLLTSYHSQDRFSEFLLKRRNQFSQEEINQAIENRRFIKNKKTDLKKKGVSKPISGFYEKFELCSTSEEPRFYKIIDKLNQEVHMDNRLILHRYQAEKIHPLLHDGAFLKPRRNENLITAQEALEIMIPSVYSSTGQLLDKFDFRYGNSLKAKNNNLYDLYIEFIDTVAIN